jgi:hypothetical protein
LRRGRVRADTATRLLGEIQTAAAGAAEPAARRTAEGVAAAFADRVRQLGGARPLEHLEVTRLDYVALVDDEYQRRHGRRRQRRGG